MAKIFFNRTVNKKWRAGMYPALQVVVPKAVVPEEPLLGRVCFSEDEEQATIKVSLDANASRDTLGVFVGEEELVEALTSPEFEASTYFAGADYYIGVFEVGALIKVFPPIYKAPPVYYSLTENGWSCLGTKADILTSSDELVKRLIEENKWLKDCLE